MNRQRKEDRSLKNTSSIADDASARDGQQQQQQQQQGHCEAKVDAEYNDSTGVDQQVFFQVNLKEITNALLVPGDMLSLKLQPLGPLLVPEASATSQTPAPSVKDIPNAGDSVSNSVSTRSSVFETPTVTGTQRYQKHYSTLKAMVLPAPDNTYYREETLVIGSVSRRGGQTGLLEHGEGATVSNREALEPSITCTFPDSSATQSLPIEVTRLSPALPGQQDDFSSTPALRGITFSVRKSSRIDSGVSGMWNYDEDLRRPLLLETTNATTITTPLISSNNNNNIDATTGGGEDIISGKKLKKKHVHFPENVIKSVSVLQADDQLRLLVEYNRPWYAHLVLLVASAFFVLHWGFTLLVIRPSDRDGRIVASAVVSFVVFGFASVYLLVYLILMWRPGPVEREFLTDCSKNQQVIYVLLAGVVAQLTLVCSFMFEVSIVSLLCFCCCPLILTYLYEEYKKHSVSMLDGLGCFLVAVSFVVFSVGVEVQSSRTALSCIAPVAISFFGGAAMAFFLFQLRTVSQHVSNMFVMTSTITLSTTVLAFLSYALDGFETPIGESHRPLSDVSSTDFLKMVLSALFLFLSWFTYHWSSLFFDRMTLSGSFSLGGPISLLVFHLLSLPTASLPYEIAGGVVMAMGCALVLFSGFRFRQNVEVRIELEQH